MANRRDSMDMKNPLLPAGRFKVAVVGDAGSGKTSLIFRFCRGRLPRADENLPSALETEEVAITRNKIKYHLVIYDTSGLEEYARLRALPYHDCDVILLCFPLNSLPSMHRIIRDWAVEISVLTQDKPVILVGTKKDLRDTTNPKQNSTTFVSRKQGKKVAKSIGAIDYFECSALNFVSDGKSINRIFGRALRKARGDNCCGFCSTCV